MEPSNRLSIATLDGDWRDKDSVLLHACFAVLEAFLADESPFDSHVDWDRDDRHRRAKTELLALQAWWRDWQTREDTLPDEATHGEEDAMLIRLIRVRWAMWT